MVILALDWMEDSEVRYFCAPFEAEWYCVWLENLNLVDGVISRDSDCVLLGDAFFMLK